MLEQCDYITCPNCGSKVPIAKMNRLGRKPLNIDVKNICDTLADSSTVGRAADLLGCSRGYIYKVLKSVGLSPRQVIEAKQKESIL